MSKFRGDKMSFKRSQGAHKRLAKKYSRNTDSPIALCKNGYHNDVLRIQAKRNKIISFEEKKRIYRTNEHFVFN